MVTPVSVRDLHSSDFKPILRLYDQHLALVTDLFAYCLLKDHFHIAVRVKSQEEILETRKTLKVFTSNAVELDGWGSFVGREDSFQGKPLGFHRYVSDQFSNFFNAYAKTINKAYGRTGSLFQHPFGRVPITTERQFWNVIAYIHQNPQKHGFVKDFRDWKYSS